MCNKSNRNLCERTNANGAVEINEYDNNTKEYIDAKEKFEE